MAAYLLIATLLATATASAQRTATAVPTVANGFVIAVTVTDGGSGYTATPTVTITGGNGSGATATAIILNGAVNQVIVGNAGSGYTGTPVVTIAAPPSPKLPFSDGLVAYWPFNGNANDESGFGDHAEVLGATLTSDRYGRLKSAYSFDQPSSQAIRASGRNITRGLRDKTFTIWFKQSTRIRQSDFHAPFLTLYDGKSSALFSVDFWINSLEIYQWGMVGYKAFESPTQPMTDGLWHHFACVVTPSDLRAFIDGREVVWNAGQPPPGTQWPMPEGDLWIGYGYQAYYDGALDDVRFYDRALSANEVRELYRYESPTQARVSIDVETVRVTMHVTPTKRYQLMSSFDLKTWTNVGQPILAGSSEIPLTLNALSVGQFFRVYEVQ